MTFKKSFLTKDKLKYFAIHLSEISCVSDVKNLSDTVSLIDPEYCSPSVQEKGNEKDTGDDNCVIVTENVVAFSKITRNKKRKKFIQKSRVKKFNMEKEKFTTNFLRK